MIRVKFALNYQPKIVMNYAVLGIVNHVMLTTVYVVTDIL